MAHCTQTPNHVPATRYYAAEWWRLNCGSHLRVLAVNHQLRFWEFACHVNAAFPEVCPQSKRHLVLDVKKKTRLPGVLQCSAKVFTLVRFFSFLFFFLHFVTLQWQTLIIFCWVFVIDRHKWTIIFDKWKKKIMYGSFFFFTNRNQK